MDFIQSLGMAHNPRGAALLINRTFNEGDLHQYKRELVKNAIQAFATEVRYTAVRFADYGEIGGVKAAFVDNGVGMSSTKIGDYIGELFNGASAMGPDGNFQMGARVSTLPWNHEGILVASWTDEEPEGTLLMIAYDDDREEYRLVGFEDEETGLVTTTGIPDPSLKHEIICKAGHGTVFVLLGSTPEDHTIGEISRDKSGDVVYPNTRIQIDDVLYFNSKFWDLDDSMTDSIAIMQGPKNLEEWKKYIKPGEWFEDAVMWAAEHRQPGASEPKFWFRRARGARERITTAQKNAIKNGGDQVHTGTVDVVSKHGYRATVHWALFPEEHYSRAAGGGSDTRDYHIPLGLFGELFQGEIYNVHKWGETRHKMEFYGIGKNKVRDRVILIVEPEKASTSFIGAVPSSSRRQLLIANNELPHDEWGPAFATKMPAEIKKRLRDLDSTGNDDRSNRLMKNLASFFRRPRKRDDGDENLPVGDYEPQGDNTDPKKEGTAEPKERKERKSRGMPRKPIGGTGRKRNLDTADSTPNVRLKFINVIWNGEEFSDAELRPMLAHYIPAVRTVYINDEHPVLKALLDDAVKERNIGHKEQVLELAKDAINNHMRTAVVSLELFQASPSMMPEGVGGISDEFVKHGYSDVALSAQLLNVTTMKRLINEAMKGKAGLKRLYVEDEEDDIAAA